MAEDMTNEVEYLNLERVVKKKLVCQKKKAGIICT